EPWNYKIDLFGELEKMLTQSYANDYEFQAELTSLFSSLQDAHTVYRKPRCYGEVDYVQPLYLKPMVRNGLVYLQAQPVKYAGLSLAPRVPEGLLGSEILEIDGKDPLQVVHDFNAEYSLSNDPNIGFTYATRRLRYKWRQADGQEFTAAVEWVIVGNSEIRSLDGKDTPIEPDTENEQQSEEKQEKRQEDLEAYVNSWRLAQSSEGVAVYVNPTAKVVVLRIS
ncbi:unnamed protein product, partial [Symbiodinium sp. KB8]